MSPCSAWPVASSACARWFGFVSCSKAWSAGPGARVLDICVRPDALQDEAARALLDAPWELLAEPKGWLAEDPVQPFEVMRRIGAAAAPRVAEFADLQMLFMAAAPEGEHVLSFEAEEAAILQATNHFAFGQSSLHLFVEETGSAEWMRQRLFRDGPFDVLHLCCHGGIDKRYGPVLALENDCGDIDQADVSKLVKALGTASKLPLLFLSACRTAERVEAGEDGRRRAAEPMARELVRAGVGHVLGWDGSVRDVDASAFAEHFYGELVLGTSVPCAAAVARQKLCSMARTDSLRGQHWHLARLYIGPQGGGALVDAESQRFREYAGQNATQAFLDMKGRQIPVALPDEFVGRRRILQKAFRGLSHAAGGVTRSVGVLLHGMGNLGKSSVAARLSQRLQRHQTVVIFKRYDPLTVFDQVVVALPAELRDSFEAQWRGKVFQHGHVLATAMEKLLSLLLMHKAAPLLLIVDDLERLLETPQPGDEAGVPVKAGDGRVALQAILTAFDRMAGRTASRLLLTSRYRFTLPDDRGNDLAERLIAVPLQPMSDTDRLKQWDAAWRLQKKALANTVELRKLMLRALTLAAGNPGLQEVLTRPLLSGEPAAAERAMAAIEQFQASGEIPADLRARVALPAVQLTAADKDNTLLQFFRRMAFETYRAALTPDQALQLRAATLFDSGLPVPRAALEAVGQKAGVADATAATDRLLGLGLLDDFGEIDGEASAGVNPLARPLCEELPQDDLPVLAQAALPWLDRVWRDAQGAVPQDARALCLNRLALAAPAPDVETLNRAAEAAARLLFSRQHDARRAMTEVLAPARARLADLGAAASHGLSHITVDCAERVGDRELMAEATQAMQTRASAPGEQAGAILYQARLLKTTDPDQALAHFVDAASVFQGIGQEREAVITRGEIADILQSRGQLDEALRIRLEEELPVYERLGDVRSKAVTQGNIADILQSRGQLDEALALHVERLTVFEQIGDIDGIAHTRFASARLRLGRGDHETGGIQAIYEDLAHAFAILQTLQRPDGIAVVGMFLAQVLAMGGQHDEALQVLDAAEQGFRMLSNEAGVRQIEQLRQAIRASGG